MNFILYFRLSLLADLYEALKVMQSTHRNHCFLYISSQYSKADVARHSQQVEYVLFKLAPSWRIATFAHHERLHRLDPPSLALLDRNVTPYLQIF